MLAATSDDVSARPGPHRESLFLLLFTSGTTGAPKAVRCSQGGWSRSPSRPWRKFGHNRDDVDYCCMPLFHGNALMALWAPALRVGATICLAPKFSATGFVADVRHFGCTYFTYVGKAIAYVLATPERSRRRRQRTQPRLRHRGVAVRPHPFRGALRLHRCSRATARARAAPS